MLIMKFNRNQQEIDEGIGSLIKGGAKLLGRAAKPVAKAAKSTAKATGGARQGSR